MAITIVTGQHTTSTGAGFATTLAATYAGNVTAGNLLVACANITGDGVLSGISDSLNGAWTLDKSATVNANVNYQTRIYSFPNTASGACTVTASLGVGANGTLTIFELAGAATSTPVDATSDTNPVPSTGTNPSFTITTVTANSCIIGTMSIFDNAWTVTAGTNFSLENSSAGGNLRGASEYWLDSGSAAANTVGFSIAGGTGGYSTACAVAYKVASGVGASSFSKPLWPMSYF